MSVGFHHLKRQQRQQRSIDLSGDKSSLTPSLIHIWYAQPLLLCARLPRPFEVGVLQWHTHRNRHTGVYSDSMTQSANLVEIFMVSRLEFLFKLFYDLCYIKWFL